MASTKTTENQKQMNLNSPLVDLFEQIDVRSLARSFALTHKIFQIKLNGTDDEPKLKCCPQLNGY